MFKCSKNKLWLENPINLLCDYKFIPLEGMNYTDQMNALSRLILIIFIIMLIIGFKESFLFLFFSLLFIIIIYYMQINKMKETFETTSCKQRKIIPNVQQQYHVKPKPYMYKNNATFNGNFKTPSDTFWYNNSINIDSLENQCSIETPYLKKELIENNTKFTKKGIINNKEYVSMNQKLVGTANPKTFIAPVITPPIADLQYWKTNNLIVPSIINSQSQIDNYQSGYEIMPTNTRENYLNKDDERLYYHKKKEEDDEEDEEETHYNKIPFIKQDTKKEQHSDSINKNCGYNPKQLLVSNLPSNLPSNYIQRNPKMKQYNENLFTSIIQPGVYSRTQVNEPINSNIGISFQQQFEPLTKSIDEYGNIIYIEHDPNSFVPKPKNSKINLNPTEYNVYDPRFTGYGTGYRGYTDELLGQPKFYYDDVDAIRMPNYIVRSNIDNQPFADSYGPIEYGNQFGNDNTENIRELANNAFLENALDFRTDLQERLMRKNNANSWQQKMYPIQTGGQRSLGGMKI